MGVTALTEQQYRRWSKDTTSPWSATGNNVGIEQLVQLAEAEIGDYLCTYLRPTRVENERHRPFVKERTYLGQNVETICTVVMHRKRLLVDRDITVTWVHHERCNCTETTHTGCATILDSLMGKLDLSGCTSGASCPCITYSDFVTVRVTYWCGFEALPIQLQRAVALLARHDAMELIVGAVPIGDDLPWGLQETQRSDLALFRSFDSPSKYAVSEQGISAFGRGMVGVEVQRLCAPFRVFDVMQI